MVWFVPKLIHPIYKSDLINPDKKQLMEQLRIYGILDILESLGIIIASIAAIWGINSWRREAKWKSKYELAEEVLSCLYESQQAIRTIRSPIGYGHEGKTRLKKDNETQEQTEIYNKAYISRERYNKNKGSLQKLHTLKFRFIALFGKEYEENFNLFHQMINKIFFASDDIASIRLGEYDYDPELRMQIMMESKKILYASRKNDDIEEEIQNSINEIENVCRQIIGKVN